MGIYRLIGEISEAIFYRNIPDAVRKHLNIIIPFWMIP